MKIRKCSAIFLFLFGLHAALADAPCDETLQRVANETGYRLRVSGIRCEGLYVSKVSRSNDLVLVGLTRGRLDLESKDTLLLKSAIPDQAIHIRAIAIPEKTYYRLDGVISVGKPFIWPLKEVVKRIGLRAEDLALSGFLDAPA